jgi:hypothetical protein
MTDIYLEFNSDLILTPSGSIQTAIGWDQVRERIIRNLITNSAESLPDGTFTPADYIFEPSYGLGMGALVDQNPTPAFLQDLKRRINQAVFTEAQVDPGTVPTIIVQQPVPDTYQIFISVALVDGTVGEVSLTLE